ncbi:MAG: hypothetical protein ACXADY_10615 [Candidatus Hodarchaeales archaeon]|jgi:excinuclease UvrABC nuclease subunit
MSRVRIKQKLENLNLKIFSWGEYYEKNDLDEIPKKSGVYALFWGDALQYIGRSNNLQRRLKDWERSHYYNEYIPFGTVSWYNLSEKQVPQAEAQLIHYYQPPYNQQYPKT